MDPNTGQDTCVFATAYAQQIFHNDLLLEKILGSLPAPVLRAYRSVNLHWNYLATKSLTARSLNSIKIYFDNPPSIQIHDQPEANPCATDVPSNKPTFEIGDLNELLEANEYLDLPVFCRRFFFMNCTLFDRDLQYFLHKFGDLVKCMTFCFYAGIGIPSRALITFDCLKPVLFSHLRNVEELRIGGAFDKMLVRNDYLRIVSPHEILPKLKSFSLSCILSEPLQDLFLHFSTRVKQVGLFSPACLPIAQVLLDHNRIRLLSTVCLFVSPECFDLIRNISGSSHGITKAFLIPFRGTHNLQDWLEASEIVNKFLMSIAPRIEILVSPPFGLYPGIEIPVMPRLKSLSIDLRVQFAHLFPTHFKYSHKFPKLRELRSDLDVRPSLPLDVWRRNLLGAGYQDEVPTVKQIAFRTGPSLYSIQRCVKMFPNLTSVTIGVVPMLPFALTIFWGMPNLVFLNFSVNVVDGETKNCFSNTGNTFPHVDSALTGFSEEVCITMKESGSYTGICVEQLRVTKSLLDAKNLRTLQCKIISKSFVKQEEGLCPISPFISGKYAFALCPQLKVVIEFYANHEENKQDLQDQLTPMLPFVHRLSESKYPHPSPDQLV